MTIEEECIKSRIIAVEILELLKKYISEANNLNQNELIFSQIIHGLIKSLLTFFEFSGVPSEDVYTILRDAAEMYDHESKVKIKEIRINEK